MTILIRSTLKRPRQPLQAIRARLERLLAAAGRRRAVLSVLVVGDHAMRTLNRRYRGKDRSTDVLSFAYNDGVFPALPGTPLGDLVLSLPAAERQARAAGDPLRRELDRLLVHGFLHLLGYDHERGRREAQRMQARERRLLEALNR